MILLDAIFIIELFLKTEEQEKEKDYILSKPCLRDVIQHDLILLENQLPFFVLEELYMFAGCDEDQKLKFVELSRNYFRRYDKVPGSIIEKKIKVEHFTDLLRHLFCPYSSNEQEEESSCTRSWQSCPQKMEQLWKRRSKESSDNILYCATKLDDAGLKFKEVKDGRRLLDIRPPQPRVFRCFPCFGCPMEVPQLVIDDYTETLLRNLMALEQCHYPTETSICNYVALLDYLIDDDKDVDLLVQKKVIDNQLGSNKIAADLINKLCNHIGLSESSYFKNIAQKVNDHYEHPLNRAMAILKRVYFPNAIRGTATVVGFIVLFFTFWSFFKPLICRLELKYMCYN